MPVHSSPHEYSDPRSLWGGTWWNGRFGTTETGRLGPNLTDLLPNVAAGGDVAKVNPRDRIDPGVENPVIVGGREGAAKSNGNPCTPGTEAGW